MALICQLILQAIKGDHSNFHLISIDEKTGIQALERIHTHQVMQPGQVRRIEYEYTRHGTTCLMAAVDVGKGNLLHHLLSPTRTEPELLRFVQQTTAKLPADDQVVFLADQLNTHLSASLVSWIAQQIHYCGTLGQKGKHGILKNKQTRKAFLENPEHRIRFVFTPKHCSWLNPIENWFSKLQRQVITYGNFSSVKELEHKIDQYIDFYNRCLIKPLNWKFMGFVKAQYLSHFEVSKN